MTRHIYPLAVLFLFVVSSAAEAQMVVRRVPRSDSGSVSFGASRLLDLHARIAELEKTRPANDPELVKLRTERDVLEQLPATAANEPSGDSSPLLSQAGLNMGKDAATVSLQAFEFLTSENTRFYVRSTLPVSADAPPAAETGLGKPSDALKAGVLDPFGGVLNATLGYYYVQGAPDGRHFALDARAGVKLLSTPTLNEGSTEATGSEPNPFGTAMALAKVVLPLWRELDADRAGTLTLALGGNFTMAASRDYLRTLTDVDRIVANLSVAAVVELPGVFYLTLEGSPWVSNRAWGKRFVVSLNALR